MIIDGKALAAVVRQQLQKELKKEIVSPALGVLVFQESPATRQFTRAKKDIGEDLGIAVDVIVYDSELSTEEAVSLVKKHSKKYDGIVVQLPLPEHIDTDTVLAAIPQDKDVDGIGGQKEVGDVLPPVVAAMKKIIDVNTVVLKNKKVVVIGQGRLVGAPAALWFRQQGADVHVANKKTEDLSSLTQTSDVVVLGAGAPRLLTPGMVRTGVIVLDAGSGEVSGRVMGDADPGVADKAALFTPTPGGIGPIAVTMIFANLLTLWSR